MISRLLKNINQPKQNTTEDNKEKSLFDELAKNAEVVDHDKMNQVEGGHTSSGHFSHNYDWNSTPGGRIPS